MRSFIFALCSLLWMYVIFYLSSITGDQLGPDTLVINLVKKSGHTVIFGILAVLYLYALKGRQSLREAGAGIFLMSLLFALLYAVSDEYHQSFIPGRHSSGTDIFIDICGALTALAILYGTKTRKKWEH